MWEHSPTRRKRWEMLRLNRGVDSPINFITIPSITSLHVVPHTSIRVGPSAWPLATRQRHLRLVRATWALPRGLNAASHPEAVPCTTSAATRHITLQVKTPFSRFLNRKNQFKNQIKIRKRVEISEIHNFKYITSF